MLPSTYIPSPRPIPLEERLARARSSVMQNIGRLNAASEALDTALIRQKDAKENTFITREAANFVTAVARRVQESIEVGVSGVVGEALKAVFGDRSYGFRLKFKSRTGDRGTGEAELSFLDADENPIDPMASCGGGAVDVAAFALRVALWTITRPRTRPVMILDEPFRFLSRDLKPLAGGFLRELSAELGLQFIIVTHDQAIVEAADRVFRVTKGDDGVSTVEMEKQEEGESHATQPEIRMAPDTKNQDAGAAEGKQAIGSHAGTGRKRDVQGTVEKQQAVRRRTK